MFTIFYFIEKKKNWGVAHRVAHRVVHKVAHRVAHGLAHGPTPLFSSHPLVSLDYQLLSRGGTKTRESGGNRAYPLVFLARAAKRSSTAA